MIYNGNCLATGYVTDNITPYVVNYGTVRLTTAGVGQSPEFTVGDASGVGVAWDNEGTTTFEGRAYLNLLHGEYLQDNATASTVSQAGAAGTSYVHTLFAPAAFENGTISFSGVPGTYTNFAVWADSVIVNCEIDLRILASNHTKCDLFRIANTSNSNINWLTNSNIVISVDSGTLDTTGNCQVVYVAQGWSSMNPTVTQPTGWPTPIINNPVPGHVYGDVEIVPPGAAPKKLVSTPQLSVPASLPQPNTLARDDLYSRAPDEDLFLMVKRLEEDSDV